MPVCNLIQNLQTNICGKSKIFSIHKTLLIQWPPTDFRLADILFLPGPCPRHRLHVLKLVATSDPSQSESIHGYTKMIYVLTQRLLIFCHDP